MNKPKLLGYSLEDLGFTLDRYTSNGDISGFNEITETTFLLSPEDVLIEIRPQIQSLMGVGDGDQISVIGARNKRQLHFSEEIVRDIPTSEMEEKDFKTLKEIGFWGDGEFVNSNNLIDLTKDGAPSTMSAPILCGNGDLYKVKTIVIPVKGGFTLTFCNSRKI